MIIRQTGENLKMKDFKEEYPKNLLATLQATAFRPIELIIEEIPDDVLAGLEYAISSLSDREQTILKMRYQEHKTYKEIGEALGVTCECIRAHDNKILHRLREPRRLGYIKYGKLEYEALIAKREAEEKAKTPDCYEMIIEALDLSVRSFNCLKKRGCDTVGDIAKLSEEEIIKTKNLGKRSMIEIATTLRSIGVTNTAWDEFVE